MISVTILKYHVSFTLGVHFVLFEVDQHESKAIFFFFLFKFYQFSLCIIHASIASTKRSSFQNICGLNSFWYSSFPIVLQTRYWWLRKYSFRCFKHAGESYVKVPILGAVSHLTLAVSPVCIVLAVIWAVYRRHVSFAWIGQDILVRKKKEKKNCLSSILSFFCLLGFSFGYWMSHLIRRTFTIWFSFVGFVFQFYWEMVLDGPFTHLFPVE